MNKHMEIVSILLNDFKNNGSWLQSKDGKRCTAAIVIADSLELLEAGKHPVDIVVELRKRHFETD
jgi:hypothetical protein